MRSHYFTNDVPENVQEQTFFYQAGSKRLKLLSQSGMFSKGEVDVGSDLLIRSLPEISGHVADFGCGWGVIGLSVKAKNSDCHVVMFDINERACEMAKRNAQNNGLDVTVVCQDAAQSSQQGFDFVISNPPIRAGNQVLWSLYTAAHQKLVAGGRMYLVVRKQQGAPSTQKKLQDLFGNCEVVAKEKGFWILTCQK